MGGTSSGSWKRRERDAAALFGARRRVLSGGGRSHGEDDVDHPRLWIEVKLRASSAVRTLWELTRVAARRPVAGRVGRKVPLLALYDKGKAGALLVVHEEDFPEVTVEWLAARDDDDLLEIEAAVRRIRMGIQEDQ